MRRLLVFLKYPTPGQVKTRLAASVGDAAASQIARACAALTLERLGIFREDTVLYVEPPEAIAMTRTWLGKWTLRPQQGRTLGERLAHATAEVFAEGARYVVTVGTDSPWLSQDDIEAAYEALADTDVVLGPSEDGGYYLIGLSGANPMPFDGIAWSSSQVYAQTVAKARALGLRVHALRRGYDVDQLEDVHRLLRDKRLQDSASAALTAIEQYIGRTARSSDGRIPSVVHAPSSAIVRRGGADA